MSLTASTLSAAVVASDTLIPVAANTGATAPNFTTGSGITYAYVDQELMLVRELVSTTGVIVSRGYNGTEAVAHSSGAAINFGSPDDFSGQVPAATAYRAYYGTLPVPLRAGAAQAAISTTAAVVTTGYGYTTSTQADAISKMCYEIRATLVAMGVWKGSS